MIALLKIRRGPKVDEDLSSAIIEINRVTFLVLYYDSVYTINSKNCGNSKKDKNKNAVILFNLV